MTKTNTTYIISIGLLFAAFLVLMLGYNKAHGSASTVATPACAITHTTAVIGNQNSLSVLSANSRRAWATIDQPINATNTVSINLGSTAVAGSGILLAVGTSTPVRTNLQVGLDTDLPYVGGINAITNSGSTTVLVTQCAY